jgi:putative transposase
MNLFKRYPGNLRKAQQALSRKKKLSSNWKKAKAKVQPIHARIANARRDFLHQTSYAISKNHAMVVMENLQVSNMSRSAAGSVEHPGRNVQQKTGLNRAILDQGWAEFRRQLEYKEYKMICSGGQLIPVAPQRTSISCPGYGHVSAETRKTQAQFACVVCGFTENADLVGAINNHRAAHARFACQVKVKGRCAPSFCSESGPSNQRIRQKNLSLALLARSTGERLDFRTVLRSSPCRLAARFLPGF